MRVRDVAKICALLILLFPLCLLFGYSGYWFLFGDPSTHYYQDYHARVQHHRDLLVRSVSVGSVLGLGLGAIVGFRLGMEEGYRVAEESLNARIL